MKAVIVLAILLCNIVFCSAQKISRSITLRDGSVVDSEYIFQAGEIITFSLDEEGEFVRWSFILFTENVSNFKTSSIEALSSNENTETFLFDIDNINWSSPDKNNFMIRPKQFLNKDNNSIYYKGTITIERDGVILDSMEITFNICPSKPKIIDVKFDYIYDWEYNDIYPNGYITFVIDSQNTNSYKIKWSQSNYFEFPTDYSFPMVEYINKSDIGYTTYTNDCADWGMYYSIIAIGKYGSAYSDTICTTDYITDPEIQKRLEELREKYSGSTGVETRNIDNVKIINNNEQIIFKGHEQPIEMVIIYDILGRPVLICEETERIEVSGLSKGYYLITYKTNSKTLIKKIKL